MTDDECGNLTLNSTGLRDRDRRSSISIFAGVAERPSVLGAWHHRHVTPWPAVLTIDPIHRAEGAVRLPGSKSISNRVLLLAALATGETTIEGLLEADDTRVMRDALMALGVSVIDRGKDAVRVSRVAPASFRSAMPNCFSAMPARRFVR